jgi:hypothetical protein
MSALSTIFIRDVFTNSVRLYVTRNIKEDISIKSISLRLEVFFRAMEDSYRVIQNNGVFLLSINPLGLTGNSSEFDVRFSFL